MEEKPKLVRAPSNKKVYSDAMKTLDERRAKPPKDPMIDWDETKTEYVKRRKRTAREALLHECVPDRKCPLCGEHKLKSTEWSVVTRRQLARFQDSPKHLATLKEHLGRVVCRSCVKKLDYAAGHKTGRKN